MKQFYAHVRTLTWPRNELQILASALVHNVVLDDATKKYLADVAVTARPIKLDDPYVEIPALAKGIKEVSRMNLEEYEERVRKAEAKWRYVRKEYRPFEWRGVDNVQGRDRMVPGIPHYARDYVVMPLEFFKRCWGEEGLLDGLRVVWG